VLRPLVRLENLYLRRFRPGISARGRARAVCDSHLEGKGLGRGFGDVRGRRFEARAQIDGQRRKLVRTVMPLRICTECILAIKNTN
jgi:hypothetical protein